MIVKQGIKNYLINLKYAFSVLGTIFLGLLFGVVFLVSGFETQVNKASLEIEAITENANVDINQFKNIIVDSVRELPWEDPTEAVKIMTSEEWLNGTLKAKLEEEISNYQAFAADIEKSIVSAIEGYNVYIAMFFVCLVLGIIGGYFLAKWLIRRNIARREILKFILQTIADSVIMVLMFVLLGWLYSLWKPSPIIAGLLLILLFGCLALFEAYLVHGYKKVKLKNIINFKNIVQLFLSYVIIYCLALAFTTIIFLITNALVGLFVAIPLLLIASIVISLSAEAYVKEYSKSKEETSEEEIIVKV